MRLHRRKAIAFLPFPSWQSLVGLVTSATAIMHAFAPPVSRHALRQRDPDPRRHCRLPAYRILSPAFVSANLLMCWSSFEAFWKPFLALV
jgi:amino acid transporter